MIKVNLSLNRYPYSFRITGHSDLAEAGDDILCAAVSAIAQTALLGLKNVVGIKVSYARQDGDMRLSLPEKLPADKIDKAQTILATMREGLADIQSGYPDLIELKEN